VFERYEPEDVVRALLDPTRPADDPVIAAVQLLMTGFGYNFYDARNVARANDQLVRAKASALLADAGRVLARLEFAYRAEYVPAPTREQPFPAADAIEPLKKLERTIRRMADADTRIRSLETPASDMIWFRIRDERALLEKLLAYDVALAVSADAIARDVAGLDPAAVRSAAFSAVDAGLARIETALDGRRAFLTIPT
jgi:hypothetical protein